MKFFLLKLYDRYVLGRPVTALLLVSLIITVIGFHATEFKLDASAESLVLENDKDLRYYRSIRARYGSDDFLVITYTPKKDLFSLETLSDLRKLRDSLLQMERVESVVSILDVPLLNSPRVPLAELPENIRTLEIPDTDIELARAEFLESPLYQNLIVSPDGKTTALQVNFHRDQVFYSLLNRRDSLREKRLSTKLSRQETEELAIVSEEFKQYNSTLIEKESEDIATVRAIMDGHRNQAELYLGGVLMIASDMIDFIRHDLMVFGVGVLVFLIVMLGLSFRKPRWVVLPMACCFATVLFMFGFLGLVEWRVTVVSSNFTSLLLIITLSLNVHLIVRYHELHAQNPLASQHWLVMEMVKTKILPSLYTALTTIVAFGSLLFSNIRPVIDFGWMMAIGITVAFLLTFVVLPAGLVFFKPLEVRPRRDFTHKLTRSLAILVARFGSSILLFFLMIIALSVIGLTKLTVENRFIDHFKQDTEIYRGMEMIDRELGGTTPLEVILDADRDFYASLEEEQEPDPFDNVFDGEAEGEAGLSGTSYWYNSYNLLTLDTVHDYLDGLSETGKTLSLATTMTLLQQLNENKPLDNFMLAVIYKKLPSSVKQNLFDPYLAQDGNQVRLSIRLYESDPTLRRNELLQKIRRHLVEHMGFSDDQVHLTGMVVLYNNMLQSLFRSQIQTLGVVFLAIMLMFMILFRSLKLAVIAIIPNLVAAGMVLGLMGWLRIPLDIMTITIAAITIGIAVDDTIHYIHRFVTEIHKDNDYLATVKRCHVSVGRAMYYTSIIVIVGFSILTLSSFMPTIYFGLLTGFAMVVAMIANLTLLAVLLVIFTPGGKPLPVDVVTQQAS